MSIIIAYMIKKELGVFLRVPGNDQQKTIWITPYQYLDHALFIAISSRFQIITSFDDFLIGWGQFSWAKRRLIYLSGFTGLSFVFETSEMTHLKIPGVLYLPFSLNFLSSRTPLLEFICRSKKLLSKLISIEQFTTSQNTGWGFLTIGTAMWRHQL